VVGEISAQVQGMQHGEEADNDHPERDETPFLQHDERRFCRSRSWLSTCFSLSDSTRLTQRRAAKMQPLDQMPFARQESNCPY
jgi:hypothetical protein